MNAPPLHRLLAVARRHGWRGDEAEDLVQEALAAALTNGRRDLGDPATLAWLAGTIRRLAAMEARGAIRRRRREAEFQRRADLGPGTDLPLPDPAGLPPSLALTARLIAAECTRVELRWLLRIGDAALRQRLCALRRVARRVEARSVEHPSGTVTPGPVRRALLGPLRHAPGAVVGSHDPDGHLFVVGRSRIGG